MAPNRIGQALRRIRTVRGLSLRELAGLVFCDHSYLSNVEAGRRWPRDRGWAERVDRALNAGGELTRAWDQDQAEQAKRSDTLRALDIARRESEALLIAPDGADLDSISDDIVDISTKARHESYDATLRHAMNLRTELVRRVKSGAYRPDEIRDLYVALGRVCGVLSYLTLDLGQADMAKVHAQAAFSLGDRAEHDQLRAWSRGTQALAHRFTKDFEQAKNVAEDGLRYVNASTGTSEPRLLCSLAASVANLGDSARAVELLDQADRVRDSAGPDEIPGLFTFTAAKQIYYHGFSLMWSDDERVLKRSAKASELAIDAWQVQRSPGDEILSQIYLATARARLGDLDGSIAAVNPVLVNPISAHFSWVRKRLSQLAGLLGEHFPDSAVATEMRATLDGYIHST
ncbi:helix-turn-helix domain-containing protein [Nocardia sp. NPDC059180]|uniref:helix-turn-helix domain-containing protein n=1 Tax=Nocardia sp. NPDC059180 TaxID=3346761 RepID=UPI003680A3F3